MKPLTPQRLRGDAAESATAEFLQQNGLALLTRNYFCRRGEIDLIFYDSQRTPPLIVFVEVRLRSNRYAGTGAESVTRAKQHKIATTALHFLQHYDLPPHLRNSELRFDVISVSGQPYQFEWFQEAFYPGDG